MEKHNRFISIGAAIGMFILILDTETALNGAAAGIEICLHTLIPSLFPFFVLSILLTGSLSGQPLRFLKPVASLCAIPEGTVSILIVSLLGGYPVGAQNTALLYQQGHITKQQAARIIAFCNNAGPAFIFGVLSCMFSVPFVIWILWFIHIISALLVGIILPGAKYSDDIQINSQEISTSAVLSRSLKAMALVCAWVILMRIVLSFMDAWFLWLLPKSVQVILAGLLELSNGCIQLTGIEDEYLRFLIASAFLSCGGLCVTLQTASVSKGIPLTLYFPGKILQCCISILLCGFFHCFFPDSSTFHRNWIAVVSVSVILIILCILYRSEKKCGIPAVSDV